MRVRSEHEADEHRPVIRHGTQAVIGRRPGDVRVRRARPESRLVTLPVYAARRTALHPALISVAGFAAVILVGTVILMLPIASATGQATSFMDALFTATSAVCVTGLVVVDTGTYWGPFGQAVIAALIQIGGFGFMTTATLLLLLVGRRVTIRQRLVLSEAMGGDALGSVLTVIRRLFIFTVAAELIGMIVLTSRFLDVVEPPQALWWGVFHAISAFNNAGFDLFGGFRSLLFFQEDSVVLLTIAALIIAGGISYVVLADVARGRRMVRLELNTKIVLTATVVLTVLGMLALLVSEYSNPDTLGGMPPGTRLLNAFFQSVTARTAGFSSVNIGAMTEGGLLVLAILMFIGGATASAAGGIKLQTFSLLFFVILSAVRGLPEVVVFQRRVPIAEVMRALSIALLALALVFVVSLVLEMAEASAFLPLLFEAMSALGTVGLSTGLTPETVPVSRLILIFAMFAGRLGPLTLVLALVAREKRPHYRWPEGSVKIG